MAIGELKLDDGDEDDVVCLDDVRLPEEVVGVLVLKFGITLPYEPLLSALMISAACTHVRSVVK